MASPDLTLTIQADTTEFAISICQARYKLAQAEANFWEQKLADAISKRG